MSHRLKYPTDPSRVQVVPLSDLLLVHYRNKKIGIEKQEGPMELRWRYTEDGKRMLVHLNKPAHYASIVLKMAVPIRIAEHDIESAVRAMLIRAVEKLPKIRLNAQHIEVIPAGFVDPGRRRVFTGVEPRLRDGKSGQTVKGAVAITQIKIVRIRLEPIVATMLESIEAFRLRRILRVQ